MFIGFGPSNSHIQGNPLVLECGFAQGKFNKIVAYKPESNLY